MRSSVSGSSIGSPVEESTNVQVRPCLTRRIPGIEQSTRRSRPMPQCFPLPARSRLPPPVTLLSFETTVTGDTAVVALTGELDVSGSALLEAELERVAADHDPARVVLDLSELEFMDSTGLRLVVLADSRSREAGRRLVLVRGAPDVQRVFAITRM